MMKLRLLKPYVFSAFLMVFAIGSTPFFLKGGEAASATTSSLVKPPQSQFNSTSRRRESAEIFRISETSKQEILADVGETVYISCSANETTSGTCEWYKKSPLGVKRMTHFFDRYQVIDSCQLKIRSVTYEDAGTIMCKTITDFAEPSTHTSQLTVTGQEDPLGNILPKPSSGSTRKSLPYTQPEIDREFFPEDRLHRAQKGGNISLKCEASGNPKPLVTWRRGSKSYTTPTVGYSYLKLSNLTEDDAGVYKCEAVNIFGKSVHDITLQVRGPLQGASEILDVTPRNITLYEGNRGNITCIARFEGDPWFVWVKQINNKTGDISTFSYMGVDYWVLPRTEIKPLGQQLYATTLLLQNVTVENSGFYHCIVAGLQGYNHSEAHVVVEKDPNEIHQAQIRRHKTITILWIFSFFIFTTMVVLLTIRIYTCRKSKRTKVISKTRCSSDTSTSNNIYFPKASPVTLSTDFTHNPQLESLSPLVNYGCCSLHSSMNYSAPFKDNLSCDCHKITNPEHGLIGNTHESCVLNTLETTRSSCVYTGSFNSNADYKHSGVSPTSDYYTTPEVNIYHHHRSQLSPHRHRHIYVSGTNNQEELSEDETSSCSCNDDTYTVSTVNHSSGAQRIATEPRQFNQESKCYSCRPYIPHNNGESPRSRECTTTMAIL